MIDEEETMKDKILLYVDDLAKNFLYYDRKECDKLPVGKIEECIRNGEISIDDIVSKFRECIEEYLA